MRCLYSIAAPVSGSIMAHANLDVGAGAGGAAQAAINKSSSSWWCWRHHPQRFMSVWLWTHPRRWGLYHLPRKWGRKHHPQESCLSATNVWSPRLANGAGGAGCFKASIRSLAACVAASVGEI
eukprot:scaffold141812_cov63-Attheya_sp.AAC.2